MAEPVEKVADPLIGRVIDDKYEIVAFVGRGGMGAVYKARQKNLKRPVAIKVLNPQHSDQKTFAGRFKREAKSASRLDHPNLMRVIDFGQEADGLLYIAMEFLDGRDLLNVLRDEGRLAPERVVDILSQTLAALAVAHEENVVHRDLKPENIMILRGKDDDGRESDQVKVCDFGIAKILEHEHSEEEIDGQVTYTATLTATGSLVGTPEYMSPEQARGEPLDARSDLYSMGIILYLLLTGKLPFTSANSMKVVLKHIEEEPKAPSTVADGVDAGLEAVCLKALRKKPEDRFGSAREMRAAIRASFGLRDSVLGLPSSEPPMSGLSTGKLSAGSAGVGFMASEAQPTLEAPASVVKTAVAEATTKELESSEVDRLVKESVRPAASSNPKTTPAQPQDIPETATVTSPATRSFNPILLGLVVLLIVLLAVVLTRR